MLAGGLGTRLSEETAQRPKPMVEIGGHPMLWHILRSYAAFDVRHFVLALGYKAEVIKEYFANYHRLRSDFTVDVHTGAITPRGGPDDRWVVDLVDTGLLTNTGGRLKRLARWLPDEEFCLTYGDGVANVDLRALIDFHRSHGRLGSVTAVRPPARFGALELDGPCVRSFTEKSQTNEGWINGGFMILNRRVIDRIEGDDTSLEHDVLESVAAEGELMAYQHVGFWQPMDTLRDLRSLQALWDSGSAPWLP